MKDYKFGSKNNWRRWCWNRISERMIKPKPDCIVLYLAGAQDLDRPIAISHGFRAANLIAIERDGKSISMLREAGVLAINSDLESVCWSWAEPAVEVLYADFCCGLTPKIVGLLAMLPFLPAFQDTTIMINLLAGRELIPVFGNDNLTRANLSGLHRGNAAMNINLTSAKDFLSHCGYLIGDKLKQFVNWRSYKSTSGQRFDSTVFKNNGILKYTGSDLAFLHNFRSYLDEQRAKASDGGGVFCPLPINSARKIAAIKAHRTMRIEGTFPPKSSLPSQTHSPNPPSPAA